MATAEVSRPTKYRLLSLTKPKPLPAGFQEDRRSVYWDNGIPPKDYAKTTKFVMSKRLDDLVYNKRAHPDYRPSRFSPIWVPSPATLCAMPTQRILELSRPKTCHPNYRPGKLVTSSVPRSALMYTPTGRVHELARHKTYLPLQIKYSEDADWQNWESRMQDSEHFLPVSSRIISLAEPKSLSEHYTPARYDWRVTKEAQNCVATERVHKLARPKNRHLEMEDYDPYTWMVSRSALLAQASPRIDELATPIPRKIRAKK